MTLSGFTYAACPVSAPQISGHFDNVTQGYDGKIHVSEGGCDYASLDNALQPIVIVEGAGVGFNGILKPTGKTSEEFKKYNDSYIQVQQEYENTHSSPDICKIDGCDSSGNPLPESQTGKPDHKATTVLDPVFPVYDPAKSFSTNAANFSEAVKNFKDIKFSSLSNSYKYRDDMYSFGRGLIIFVNKTYPLINVSFADGPERDFQIAQNKNIRPARELLFSQIHEESLPQVVRDNYLRTPSYRRAEYNEYFQTIVDPLAVLSGQGQGTGQNGKDGIDGADGKDGQDGQNGRDGLNGKDGANGQDGKDGIDGAPGSQGEKGDKGDKGEGVDNEELARFHHDSVMASGQIIGLLGRIHDAVIASGGSQASGSGGAPSPVQGGSSATDGQAAGSSAGSPDGTDSGLLSEVQGFHHDANENARKLLEALTGQPQPEKPGDNGDDDDIDASSLDDSLDEFSLLKQKDLIDYEGIINNIKVPEMDVSNGFTDMFKGASGVCKPFSFEITLPQFAGPPLRQRMSMDNFCFFWDTYARGLINFSFDIAAFIACYFILMRGMRKYE